MTALPRPPSCAGCLCPPFSYRCTAPGPASTSNQYALQTWDYGSGQLLSNWPLYHCKPYAAKFLRVRQRRLGHMGTPLLLPCAAAFWVGWRDTATAAACRCRLAPARTIASRRLPRLPWRWRVALQGPGSAKGTVLVGGAPEKAHPSACRLFSAQGQPLGALLTPTDVYSIAPASNGLVAVCSARHLSVLRPAGGGGAPAFKQASWGQLEVETAVMGQAPPGSSKQELLDLTAVKKLKQMKHWD